MIPSAALLRIVPAQQAVRVSKPPSSIAVGLLLNSSFHASTTNADPITPAPMSRRANPQACLVNPLHAVLPQPASTTKNVPTAPTVSACRSSAPAIIASSEPIARTTSPPARRTRIARTLDRISNIAAPMAIRLFAKRSFRSPERISPALGPQALRGCTAFCPRSAGRSLNYNVWQAPRTRRRIAMRSKSITP